MTKLGSTAVGAGIIVKNDEVFKVHQSFLDPKGRYVAIIGDHEDGRFLIVSFYAPYIEREIKEFVFNDLSDQIAGLGEALPEFIILGGDTNTPFSKLDKMGGSNVFKTKAIHAYNDLMSRYELFDTFRVKNPFQTEFSWEKLNPSVIRERIDMIFASNNLQDSIWHNPTI